MKVYKGISHVTIVYDNDNQYKFTEVVSQQIINNQDKGWQSEIQYTTCSSNGSIVYSALILAYTEE